MLLLLRSIHPAAAGSGQQPPVPQATATPAPASLTPTSAADEGWSCCTARGCFPESAWRQRGVNLGVEWAMEDWGHSADVGNPWASG